MYIAYAVDSTSEQMLAKFPRPAIYEEGQIYLFGETLQQVANIEPVAVVDLSDIELTDYELCATIRGLVDNIIGVEIHLSDAQGLYLYISRAKKEVTYEY